jgi:DNA-directed RNA polymerase subunit omega
MARGIIENALKTCEGNQFNMILIAAARAKMLENGAVPLIARENSTPAVLALRELAEGYSVDDFLGRNEEDEDELED